MQNSKTTFRPAGEKDSRGFALVVVLLVTAIFFALAIALLFQGRTERIVAVNEFDHLAALGYSEAGLTWAKRRILNSSNVSDLLNGPDNGQAADDNLLGLRDLSLTATSGFTTSNEGTASAIVTRDFDGEGNKKYEVVRLNPGRSERALVYVRIDDNYDDDSDDPSNNAPLADTDQVVQLTVVAEYPVFVGTGGVEQANLEIRGRARRMLVALLVGGRGSMAIASEGDVDIHSSSTVCGACGNVHSNGDVALNAQACGDVTAVGSVTGGGSAGSRTSGATEMWLPDVSPYDEVFVPDITAFDTTGQPVSCGPPTPTDPGNSKYFALVANDRKGLVFKGYWDFVNERWAWRLIADLDTGIPDELLDKCGRTNDDPNYGTPISDSGTEYFYGWKNSSTPDNAVCPGGGCPGDDSMCVTAANDFTLNGYYEATASNDGQNATTFKTLSGWGFGQNVAFPGAKASDGVKDWYPNAYLKNGKWDFSSNTLYDPIRNAVLFVFGTVYLSGDPGRTGTPKIWPVSIISYGSIEVSGNPNLGPANPEGGYYSLLVSGRDIKISGNYNEDHPTCSGSCPGTPPLLIENLGGTLIAHEQIEISGNPDIFGLLYAEDAIQCGETAQPLGGILTSADTDVHYDCVHPPNPWAATPQTLWWQERE